MPTGLDYLAARGSRRLLVAFPMIEKYDRLAYWVRGSMRLLAAAQEETVSDDRPRERAEMGSTLSRESP